MNEKRSRQKSGCKIENVNWFIYFDRRDYRGCPRVFLKNFAPNSAVEEDILKKPILGRIS